MVGQITTNNIRGCRLGKGFSIDLVAHLSGICARKLSLMERGFVKKLKEEDLKKLAQVLDANIDELRGDQGNLNIGESRKRG